MLSNAVGAVITTSSASGVILDNEFISQPPVVGNLGAAVSYIENAAPLRPFSAKTITDPDTVNYALKALVFQNTNGQVTDSLAIVPNSLITV